MRLFLGILLILYFWACSNDTQDIKSVLPSEDYAIEVADSVEILYSDSAVVRVRITSPTLKRYSNRNENFDEFPDGLLVEFLDENKRVKSWLVADYAIRKDKDAKIYVEENVVLYNKRDDKLHTNELIWDENTNELYTSKPVKITQPSIGDTSFGFGFRADQEFTRFEIQRRFSAIKNVDDFADELKG